MSVAEIMREIPRLSLPERRMLTHKLLELEPGRETLETCDHLTDEALQILDRMEEDMPAAYKGEIWQTDLGMVAKVRPCLILTDPPADDELALVTVCHHTTALRANRWEISIPKPFLKEGAFHLQQINTISMVKLLRKLGELNPDEWDRFYDRFLERFSA